MERCEFSRKGNCPNKPWRVIDVSWHGRVLAHYKFCRKHYAQVVHDGLTPESQP